MGKPDPHLTLSPGPRPTSVPSGILIHPAVWLNSAPPNGHSPFGGAGFNVGLIKMKLGMEVDPGPGRIVLDGDPALLPKRSTATPPNFRRMSVVAKRLDGLGCHLAWR